MTPLLQMVDGRPTLTTEALALLLGVSAAEIAAAGEPDKWPPQWLASGRRRRSDAEARVGSAEVNVVLAYWAKRDRGARVVIGPGAASFLIEREVIGDMLRRLEEFANGGSS
jgi:hypothetical protein